MKFLNKNKKIFVVIISGVILCIGILCLIYEKNKNDKAESIMQNIGNENFVVENNDFIDDSQNQKTEETESEDDNEDVIFVHIIGEVNYSGVLKLKQGQRIIDAIEVAGGTTENADLSRVNLAYVLSDGQQINIPSIYDDNMNFYYVTENSGENVITDDGKQGTEKSQKVNINTATQTELETLTGIGPSIANRIIEYREKNGKFKSVEELKNVSGIGEAKYESIKDSVSIK